MHPTEVVVEVDPITREWEQLTSDDGRAYYHNVVTGATSWEPPPGFQHGGTSTSTNGEGGKGEQPTTFTHLPRKAPVVGKPTLEKRTSAKQLQRTLFDSLDASANDNGSGTGSGNSNGSTNGIKERSNSYVKKGVRAGVLTSKRPSKSNPASAGFEADI